VSEPVDYNDNRLRFPEDVRITDEINLISYDGTAANIGAQVLDINIYESIYNNFLTGDITFVDTFGLSERLPIIGQEFLEFKFRTPIETPGKDIGIQEYNFIKRKMFVYKVTQRKKTTKTSQTFTLEFTSYEGVKNNLVRVSRAFNGSYDKMVADVFKKQWGLGSKKRLFIQPTKGNYKYVVPNLRPVDFINQIAARCKGSGSILPGYQFYENIQGFHFRSIDSIYFVVKGGNLVPHPVVFEYFLESQGQPADDPEQSPLSYLRRVYKYRFQPSQDLIQNARNGTWASHTITHDLYNKTVKHKRFNYIFDYNFIPHMTKDNSGYDILSYFGHIPRVPYDFHNKEQREHNASLFRDSIPAGYKTLADYSDGKTILQSDTQNLHNTNATNGYELEETTPLRHHAKNVMNQIQLIMEVPGNTGITVGQVIRVNVPRYSQSSEDTAEGVKKDKYLSEKWIITHIRHMLNPQDFKHRTIITCSKETLSAALTDRTEPFNIEVQDEALPRNIENDKTYS